MFRAELLDLREIMGFLRMGSGADAPPAAGAELEVPPRAGARPARAASRRARRRSRSPPAPVCSTSWLHETVSVAAYVDAFLCCLRAARLDW